MAFTSLPRTQSELLAWSTTFNAGLQASGASYGMSTAQIAQYLAAHNLFSTTLAAALDPATRTKGAVAAKDSAMQALRTLASAFGTMILANPAVDDQAKIDLGLEIRKPPTPVPIPAHAPRVSISSVQGHIVTGILQQQAGAKPKKSRPDSVMAACLFSYVGDVPPTVVDGWRFESVLTKTDFTIVFPPTLTPGTKVWVTANWVNTRGETSVVGTPQSAQIQYGGISQSSTQTSGDELKEAA